MLRRSLLIAALILSLGHKLFGASERRISLDLDQADVSAINQNFNNINNELRNMVHKTSTETIHGYKYFINPVDFGTVTADSGTITSFNATSASVTNLTATTGTINNIVSSSIGTDQVAYSNGTKLVGSSGFTNNGSTLAYTTSATFATSSGNVGIGTTSPESKLEVQGLEGADAALTLDADDGDDNADTWFITSQASDNDLTIKNHTTELMRLNDDGKVGINTTSPNEKLEVVGGNIIIGQGGSNNTSIGFYKFGTGSADDRFSGIEGFRGADAAQIDLRFYTYGGDGDHGERVRIQNNGKVHIRPSGTPDVELEISNGASTGGGTAHAASFAAHSSRDLKSHIRYLNNGEKLVLYNDVKNLKPAEFRYKIHRSSTTDELIEDPTGPLRNGLILEDVPPSLRKPYDNDAISLNDQVFILQAAIQVLIQKVEALEARP